MSIEKGENNFQFNQWGLKVDTRDNGDGSFNIIISSKDNTSSEIKIPVSAEDLSQVLDYINKSADQADGFGLPIFEAVTADVVEYIKKNCTHSKT